MKLTHTFSFVACFLLGLFGSETQANQPDWPACGNVEEFPGKEWIVQAPEVIGWDATALARAFDFLETIETSGAMVVHKGRLVGQWGEVAQPHIMASLRKSILSGLIGTYTARGKSGEMMDVHKSLDELGVNDSEPPLTEAEKKATFVHLLSARSGIYHSAHYEMGGWKRAKKRMAQNGGSKPGATWLYNNWDFNAAGSILESEVGETLGEGFASRIARPTKMQDFSAQDVSYVGNESFAERRMGNLSDFPAFMFTMSVRDLARFGLVYLNCGRWEGAEVIPENWVFESTLGQAISDGAPDIDLFKGLGDYGYMWWVDKPDKRTWPQIATKHPVYFGQGAKGHYLWIAPYLDLVVVHQVATPGGIGTFDQVRRRLFGQPSVSDNEFMQFLLGVLVAHPEFEESL